MNNVTLRHEDSAMIRRAVTAFEDDKLLEEFVPLPDNTWNYEFCVSNWGTKWDVGGELDMVSENIINLSFDSAWSPPIEAFRKMEELGFEVEAFYYEPGMCFCGKYTDGYDDYYELSGQDGDWVRDNIPTEIDEMFAISENLDQQEYEED
jgi:hypothetical protein